MYNPAVVVSCNMWVGMRLRRKGMHWVMCIVWNRLFTFWAGTIFNVLLNNTMDNPYNKFWRIEK